MKKNNYSICPCCHKRINPLIGMCICGYEPPNSPKLRPLRSYRPKKMSQEEWLTWIKINYGSDAHKRAVNSANAQK